MRFQTDEFGKKSVIREARIQYIPISSQTRQLIPFKLSVKDIELQDNIGIELGSITRDNLSNLFMIEPIRQFSYERKDNVWVAITIERNLSI